ncbi:MAG: hypothetical protein KKA19_06900 [Candidatus Margulisbacteria bacterium]|nr:hypothetical protein [Candidatus Margulisiibacteriota bacterium]
MNKRKFIAFILYIIILISWVNQVSATTTAGTIISNTSKLYAYAGSYSVDSNTVTTNVNVIHGIDINTNTDISVLPSQTAYFPKTLTNVGNTTENVIYTLTVPSQGWTVALIEDTNNDGVHQAGETTLLSPSMNLAPASQYRFFVAMTSPATYNVVGTVNLTVSASAASLGVYTGDNFVAYGGLAVVSAANTASTVVSPGAGGPVIIDLQFDGVPVVNFDYIGRTPLITARILDSDGVATASITISIDGIATTAGIIWDGETMTYQVPNQLGLGRHLFTITAKDILNNQGQKDFTGTISDKVMIVGRVLVYPNPYNPQSDGDCKITYQLTNDSDIRIFLHSITGERLWQDRFYAGSEGGRTGYNEVSWNGESGFYERVGNGVYLVYITNGKGKFLAKTKILVIR